VLAANGGIQFPVRNPVGDLSMVAMDSVTFLDLFPTAHIGLKVPFFRYVFENIRIDLFTAGLFFCFDSHRLVHHVL